MERVNLSENTKKQIRESETIKLAYSCEEFGKSVGLSKPMVYELIHADGFPALQVGRKWLIPVKAAEAWLAANIGKQLLSN